MIYYGGDYNPEQWDQQTVAEDIALMQEAGVNLVSVAIFGWSRLEPKDGVYEFGFYRDLLDRLHAAGIDVDLATGTASPPPWLGEMYPETLPVRADGTALTWGSRQQYNPASTKFREKAAELVEELAREFGSHPAVVMWHVSNEYGCHVSESFDPESRERFRLWLQARYGTLEQLNEAWGTQFWSQRYTSWSQVEPPANLPTFHNPIHLARWREFWSDQLLECYLAEKRVLQRVCPDLPVTTNYMGFFPTVDYWKWSPHLDLISNDFYPEPGDPRAGAQFAASSDLMRSLGGGRPFWQMEQTPSTVQWRDRNSPKRPGQFRLWSLGLVARGADAVLQFQWRQSRSGAETYHSGMVPHAGKLSPVWEEMVQTGADLKKLAPVAGHRLRASVAILWDWPSLWAAESAIGPIGWDPLTRVAQWHQSLYDLGFLVDFASPDSDLSGYEVVVVPSLFQVLPGLAEKLAGKTVIVTAGTGYQNGEAQVHLGGYLGPLRDLLGVRVVDLLPVAPTGLATGRITGAVRTRTRVQVRLDGQSYDGDGWAERIQVDQAEVVATFEGLDVDGLPAITRRGSAWYVGSFLDEAGRAALLERVLGSAPGGPQLAELPAGLEVVSRGPFQFLLNHGEDPVQFPVSAGTDLLTGRVARGQVTVGPRDAVVLDLR